MKKVAPLAAFVLAAVFLTSSFALFASEHASASGNNVTIPSYSPGSIFVSARGVGFLSSVARYLSPTPTVGTCDTASAIEVEASAGTPGPTGYTTLKGAFDAINAGTHQGTITIDVCGNTTETAPAVLNASGAGSASYTAITVSPAGGATRTISGAIAAGSPLIDFNGADNVTIDGLNTGGNALTISNTTLSATSGTSTIRFINGATNNTLTNSNLQGSVSSTVATNGAVIFFSTDASTANGNDNNTISNNNIGPAGANLPTKAILGNGSTTTTAIGNSGIVINNNNIFDYFGAAVTSSGIATNGGCNTWTITNNRFYQTTTRTWTTGAIHRAIDIANATATSGAQGFTITGNIIGYASNSQTGTYTLTGSTGKFQGIVFNGITAGTSSDISSNTIASVSLAGVTSSGAGTSSPFVGVLVTNGVANTNSNTIGSQSATGSLTFSTNSTTATDILGIYNASADSWTANSNNIGGISATNAAASGTYVIYGLRTNAGALTANSNLIGGTVANSIQLTATGVASQVIGMHSTSAACSFTGNTIRNLTSNIGTGTTTGASVIGINLATTTVNHTISQNTIHTLSNTNTGTATTVTGIQFNASTGPNLIARNFIHSLSAASVTAIINGIQVSGGTATYRNNMVRLGIDAAGNSITTALSINGINEIGGTNNFYFNSVYIGGSGVGTTASNTFAFNSTVTTNIRNFQDNIFFNARSNSTTGGKHYAVRVAGTAPNPAGLTINYNVYFVTGTGGVFGLFNGADVTSLANWRTAVGQDANSQFADPLYVNPTGTSATVDLHVQGGFATPVEGVGVDIPSVTDDFDGQTRGTLTPVDIGADAGLFVSADVSAPVISYTPLGNTSSLSNRILTATIMDASGVPTSGSFVPRIYYKKNSDPYFSSAGTLSTGSSQSGTWNFTIVVADMGGVAGGDTISYFVIAQDNVGNLASNPAGAVASDVNTVTTPPGSPNSYIIPSISGTFNVGAGGDYTTLTAAVAAYNGAVVNGPVVFRLTDASYPSETFPITINTNNGSSATNTLTIVPASGVSPALSGSSGGADTSILKLNAADYVIIDGSNNGTSSRDLTISNTSTNSNTAVIWLSSTGAGAGATNNVVKNCNLAAGANQSTTTTTNFGILSSGVNISIISDGADNDTNTFSNNSITQARYGIFLRGATGNANDNNLILSNLVGPTGFGPSEIGKGGIIVQHQNLVTVTQNEVRFVGGDFSNRAITLDKAIGIGVGSETWTPTAFTVTNSIISRNLIHDIVDEKTGSAIGIVVAGTGTPSANVIANNMLFNIHCNATSTSNQTVGIGIGAGNGDKVVFNSISLTGDLDPSSITSTNQSAAGIRIVSSTPTNLTLKNNITAVDVNSNTLNPPSSTPKHFSIIAPSTSYNWGTGGANNNDYYVNPGNTQAVFGAIGTNPPYTQVTTLSSWRTQFTPAQDAASQNVNPPFISATNLHLSNASATTLESGGMTISGVTDDFDGETRNSPPDIGADEGGFTAGFANDIAASAFIDPANGGTKQAGVAFSPQASFANVGTNGQTNVPVRYRIVDSGSNEVYNQTTTIASLPFGNTATATFPSATIVSGGTYTIFAKAELAGDGNAADDEISGSITVVVPISGSHTVGSGQEYSTITAALSDLNSRGVSGPVTLTLTSSYTSIAETLPITINPITGASSTNTITIKPDTGISSTISGSTSGCLLKLNGADHVIVDGSNSPGGTTRDLTITNTSTAAGTAAICLVSLGAGAGATDNTIKNTNIAAGVDQTANSANLSFAVLSGGSPVTTTSDGLDNDNNTFTNNFITKARYGIFLRGKAGNLNDNNIVSGNLIGPAAFGASEIGVAGIFLQYQNAASVTQNEVRFVGSLFAQNGFDNARAGIVVGGIGTSPWQPVAPTNVTNTLVTRNLIHDIVDEHEFSALGIILAGVGLPSNNVVANNMIYGVRANGTGGDQGVGIGITNGDGDKVVFNSVSLTGDMDPIGTVATTGSAAALRINSAAVSNLTLKDNILAADVSSNTGALKHYTIEAPSSSYSWGTGGANNNDFYFNGSNAQMALGGLGEPLTDATFTTVSNLASWQATFTPNQDSSSISANPLFTSATNLHISSPSSPVVGAGTAIAGITNDFDGDTRDASMPDIGADEFAVNFSSSGSGNLPPGNYDNVTINSPHVVTLTSNITVNNAIIVKAGATLDCGTFIFSGPATFLIEAGGTLGVGDPNGISSSGASGNIQVTGSRTYTNGSNYIYDGSSAQATGNGLPATVNNLTISNTAGVSLSQNVTVSGLLSLASGDLITSSFVLTQSGTSDPAGPGDVVGDVARNDLTTTPKQFGNPNNQITINSGSITTLTINLDKGETPTDFPQSVRRNYTLTPGAGTLTQATVRLHYIDTELNGNIEDSTLHLWRKDGSTWTDVGQSSASSTDNWVEYNNVTGFSPWTISGPSAPTAVKLTRFDAAGFSDGVQLIWESGFEVNNLGYHIYREQNGVRTRVTPAVVAGSALKVRQRAQMTAGYSYAWFDSEGTPNSSYYLEAIDLNGERVLTGPISPSRAAGESPAASRKRALLLSDLAATAPAQAFEQSSPDSIVTTEKRKTPKLAPSTSAPLLATQQSVASGAAVKISVARSSWYRVTQQELLAAGLDPGSDPRRLQLFVDGQEIPIRINGGDQGRLNAGDSIEFYGLALDTLTTDTHIYWLINGTGPGKRINGTKINTTGQDLVRGSGSSSFALTTERRDKMIYFSSLLNGDGENIFGPPVTSYPETQTLTVRNVDPQSTQARLAVSLQGLTDLNHEVQVQLNGTTVGTISFNGLEHPVQSFTVSRALLREGNNDVTMVATGGDADVSLVDSVALTYSHTYRADDNMLRFSVAGGQTVVISGFTSPNIRVIDVTNPATPNEPSTVNVTVDGSYGVKLQPPNGGTRSYLAFTDDLASHPIAVKQNQPSALNIPQVADMLIVTHRDFRDVVEPLAAQRRSEGLAVTVVDIEDVYDEFSFGAHSPQALRDFLSWANSHWTRAPRYLLLVGDSSWDPRNYLDQGFGDFVPTKLIDTVYMETASDDWLADFNGDGVADISVGRLPGRTPSTIELMVSKILAYEHERQLGTPLRGALMVADNEFEGESASTAALLPPTMAVQTINRSAVGSDDLMRSQILTALNNGPLIANYFGHGSVTVWTGAGLLDSDMAATLTNSDRPSLFVLMTCLNGYTHDAYIDSLAESLLKAENGGAMAVWSSSGFTEPEPQFAMSNQFYQQLFGATAPRLGDAARVAKGAIADPDVRRTWMLMGDPSMRIR